MNRKEILVILWINECDFKKKIEKYFLTNQIKSNQMDDTELFRNICSDGKKGTRYDAFSTIDNPMILFSKIDGRALASVHLRCQSNHTNNGRCIITKRVDNNNHIHFQGLINKNNQEFELVVTNLTDLGDMMINVNKKNNQQLNQVNVIKPLQSYAIKCDKTNNGALVLNIIKDKTTGENKTIMEDEKLGKSFAKGVYYDIIVTPSNSHQMVNLFAETFWACSDVFVTKRKQKYWYDGIGTGIQCISLSEVRNRISDFNNNYYEIQNHNTSNKKYDSDSDDYGMDDDCFGECDSESQDMDDVVKNSFASKVDKGRYIKVKSKQSTTIFSHYLKTKPRRLGLSVSDRLVFRKKPNNDKLAELGRNLIQNISRKNNPGSLLFDKLNKVYDSNECVVCLENSTNCIFYQCGHKCCHYNCAKDLDQCPLCRGYISAYLVRN